MTAEQYHIIIYCPEDSATAVRRAAAQAGAGQIGHYDHCSFSSTGTGRFRALSGAKPTVGEVGTVEEVTEERIEISCPHDILSAVITALTEAHPYEEPALHVLPMIDYKTLL